MSYNTLTEALTILSQELGYDSFTTRSDLETKSDIKVTTSGESNVLNRSGSGDLSTIVHVGDLVVIGFENYKVQAVTANSLTIDTPVNLATDTTFYYVLVANIDSFNDFNLKKERALFTANKEIVKNLVDPELPADDILQEAEAKLAAIYYSNSKKLPNSKRDISRIQSEKIGDMSTNYDTSKGTENLPEFIIEILGNYYKSKFDPVFFQR